MDRLTAVTLHTSRISFYLRTVVLLLALAALWLCGLSWWWQAALSAALLAGAFWQETKCKQLSVSALGCEQEQWWALVDDVKRPVELVGAQLVLSWLIVLNFRINEADEKKSAKKYALALWPDTAKSDDLRRLRVWLRNR